MSLDFYLTRVQETTVFDANITHNLTGMASALGIYEYLWHPQGAPVTSASQLIMPLRHAILELKLNPDLYDRYSAKNGWGTREQFLPWLERVLAACEEYPDAKVSASV